MLTLWGCGSVSTNSNADYSPEPQWWTNNTYSDSGLINGFAKNQSRIGVFASALHGIVQKIHAVIHSK